MLVTIYKNEQFTTKLKLIIYNTYKKKMRVSIECKSISRVWELRQWTKGIMVIKEGKIKRSIKPPEAFQQLYSLVPLFVASSEIDQAHLRIVKWNIDGKNNSEGQT